MLDRHAPLPWTFTPNSWRETTIYDAEGLPVCLFDLLNWPVTEDNQEELMKAQAELAVYIVKAVNEYSKLQDKIEAPDGKEYRSWVYQLVAEKDKLVEALQAISGGSFQDAGIFAVKGEWQKFANSLQAIATHAIEQTAGAA